jgi:flagellar biosynthesis protein FlhF
MSDSPSTQAAGACYKFTVKSAEQAAALIRERLGPSARVLSVRTVEASGLSRLWASPRLEVIAQIENGLEGPLPDAAAARTEPAAGEAGQAAPDGNDAAQPADNVRTIRTAPPAGSVGAASLPALLRRSGLSELALARLQAMQGWNELLSAPLHRALVEAGLLLQGESARRHPGAPLSRAAFLGTPGAGRTTALCKWLGAETFRRARLGHVVTAEFDRPNPPGALTVFCEALGVPVAHYPGTTEPVVPGGFVYFDLPGISLRDPSENAAIADFLARESIEQRVLVLNAAYDHAALRSSYAAGRALGATHVVFTHLDEVPQWGRLWDYIFDGALEPLFLATGPSLTGDCEEQVWDSLVRRTLAGGSASPDAADSSGEDPAEETPSPAAATP